MKRRKPPLERLEVQDAPARAKVQLVLEVLSGEKPIARACQESGLKALAYYKLEARMLRGMLAAAQMLPGRRSRLDPATEAAGLLAETEALRQEHRRMKSLLRVSRKLFGLGRPASRKGPARRPSAAGAASPPGPEPGKRLSRTPSSPAVSAQEIRKEKEE